MDFIKKHKKLWLGLGIPSLALLAICAVALPITSNYQTVINQVLNIKTTKIVKDENAENEDTQYFKSAYNTKEDLQAHEEDLCADVMAEGAVLLRNNDVGGKPALPLASGAKVSLFSQSSVRPVYGGTGSGAVNVSSAPTFKNALAEEGITANPSLWAFYETGDGSKYSRKVPSTTESKTEDFTINEVPWSKYGKAVKNSFSAYGDAAIVTIARAGGEGCDLAINNGSDALDGDYLKLNQDERDMMAALKQYKEDGVFNKIIVLLNTSNMVSLDFLDEFGVDAAMWIGDIGGNGIVGVSRILSGKVNPSGRTVETFLKNNHLSSTFTNFGINYWTNLNDYLSVLGEDPMGKTGTYNNAYVAYQEGIYVGYKYFETRYFDKVMGQGNAGDWKYDDAVAYPFGTGLSYSTFDYSNFSMTQNDEELTFKVTVTNKGTVAGKHTVELYANLPYTAGGIEKSATQLVGFDKTEKLEPNAKEEVSITINKRDLTSYDAYDAKTYVLDAGDYNFTIAHDAHAATNNFLAHEGKSTANGMDAAGNNDMVKTWNNATTDKTTYATSPYTNKPITNQFDDADILSYNGIDATDKANFKYLSRNDWTGTYPTAPVSLKVTDQMTKDGLVIKGETYTNLVEKFKAAYQAEVGEITTMPTLGASNGLTIAMLRQTEITSPLWDDLIDQMTVEEMISLVTQGFHQTNPVASIGLPGTKDENGPQGLTASLIGGASAMCYTSADILAATYNRELVKEVGSCMGEDCLYGGYSGMYAPGANIHRSAYEGRSFEYYSEDGFLSGEICYEESKGISSKGVWVMAKHFFLNDQEAYRTGIATFAGEQAMREIYLKAFEKALTNDDGLISVMNAFNRLGVKWSGEHRGSMTGIIRNEWGNTTANITDCSTNLHYMDGVLGVLSGTTLWDGSGKNSVASLDDYTDDPVVVHALKDASKWLSYTISRTNAMNGISSSDKIVILTPWYTPFLTTMLVVFGVLTLTFGAFFIMALIKKE